MRAQAERWLKEKLGPSAAFRDGQWEAIEALVAGRQRTLVVQRTGWGKSLVYFMAARLLRQQRALPGQQGAGVTLLISPLLSLMRNQMQAAAEWGVRAQTVNSTNADEHARIQAELLAGKIDLLYISPERLANDRFLREVWPHLRQNVGLLVVDEAHCISDWGHDFRPNYRRIMRLLDELPAGTPVLGTTATANDRVVADVAEILGAQMNIVRGSLTRDSLKLYVYPEPYTHAYRLTLMSHLLKSIDGSGIIYCMTTRDCRLVAEWLQKQGLNVKPYYADVEENGKEKRPELERQLLANEVKALVASVALGMGFDKPDLRFVIHYQHPGSLISYYQQIGRAGRGIAEAFIVLMHGPGDEDIQRHFIETAFPEPRQVEQTILALARSGPLTQSALQQEVNANRSTLEKILTHLEVERIIEPQDDGYHLLDKSARPDYERWQRVTEQRVAELEEMKAYIRYDGCLMRYIADVLDDPAPPERCGKCKNCRQSQSNFVPDAQAVEAASQFLRQGKPVVVEPRLRWPHGLPGIKRASKIEHSNQPGIALCNYYDAGWSEQVKQARNETNRFSDELLQASVELLRQHFASLRQPPLWVTSVPSQRRPQLVADFAARLAAALKLPYQDVLTHVKQHPEQRTMRNSFQQAMNVFNAYAVEGRPPRSPALLVDDIADSRWTLTVIGALLQSRGAGPVYPFVLASTAAE